MEGLDPEMVDANDFIQMIQDMGAMVVIPVRSNRNNQLVQDRNLVERFCNKIKQFRRIANEKLDRNFMSRLNFVYHHLVAFF